MGKDINKEPYDETTLTKLNIFEQYLREWLPVFILTQHASKVMICDFCAGSGQDSDGVPGSPLRILRQIEEYRDQILAKDIAISVVLNEASAEKFNELEEAVACCFDQESWGQKVSVSRHNEEFQDLFRQQYEQLKKQPNLLFIDQYGVKEVPDEIFQMLIALDRTDFLFFVSSSYVRRFAEQSEFKAHLPDIDPSEVRIAKYEDIHRLMLRYYREAIPEGNPTKLYPFTLKKGSNIYGLIFGSKHPLGAEKFLHIAWNTNEINGEANFDIDDDIPKKQRVLYREMKQRTKKEVFEDLLTDTIRVRGEVTNREVYNFALDHGHPTSHARECVNRLKKEGKVEYNWPIGFTYRSCYKKEPKTIRWLTRE